MGRGGGDPLQGSRAAGVVSARHIEAACEAAFLRPETRIFVDLQYEKPHQNIPFPAIPGQRKLPEARMFTGLATNGARHG